ncbi:MAG: MFS transporter [Schleiferiaceae bacterium]
MKLKGLRWYVLGLVGIATVINYIDRNALAIMWPGISEDLGMDKNDYAFILSFFMVAYALGQSVFGKIFDVIGTRISFVLSILLWSFSVALHAVAKTATSFGIFRFTMGFGEAGNWPGATKSNAEWFPIRERALAQGLFNAGASIGAIVSAPLIAVLYTSMGWQWTFVAIAVVGSLWVIPWLFIYKKGPSEHPWITENEQKYILDGQKETETQEEEEENPEEEVAMSWKQLLSYRQSWAIILSRFFVDPVWWLFVSWLPIYLAEEFGFDVKEIGLFAWVPYVGAAVGSVVGGWVSGLFLQSGRSVNFARKFTITLGGIIMLPSLLLTAGAATPLKAVLLIALILFGFQMAIGNIQTLPSDFFGRKNVGSLSGLGGTAAVLGVLVTIWLVPIITVESYVPFFILGAILVPLGIGMIWLLGGNIKKIDSQK